MGRELFNWDEKRQLSGQRNGSKVTGVGVAISPYSAGKLRVRRDARDPPGRPAHHPFRRREPGHAFRHSIPRMVAAEVLDAYRGKRLKSSGGTSSRGNPLEFDARCGSQTTHAHTRANYAAGLQAKRLLQEIAAADFGGAPENYDVGGGRVFRMGSPSVGMSFGQAAERAIELGGRYDGHELNESLEEMTVRAVQEHLVGEGLVAAATDEFSHEGATRSTVVAFARRRGRYGNRRL